MKTNSLNKTAKKLFKKLTTKIKSFLNRVFVTPVQKYLEEKEKDRKHKRIINEFEKTFNTDIDKIKAIMYRKDPKNFGLYVDPEKHEKYINETLMQGRQHIIKINKYIGKTPLLYEPDMVEIHNENLNPNVPTLEALIEMDGNNIKNAFKKQGPPIRNIIKTRNQINTEDNIPLSKVPFNSDFDLSNAREIDLIKNQEFEQKNTIMLEKIKKLLDETKNKNQ